MIQADTLPPGSDLRSTTSAYMAYSPQKMHPANETYRAEEPPYGVSGAAGGDENAHRRAACHYNRTLKRELEGGDARMIPIQHKEHKA
jgi:hypothetical protein